MLRWLRQWWHGKDVRVDPDEPDMVGGLGVFHQYRNQKHWTSAAAHRFVAWHEKNWGALWALVISAFGVLVAYLALK